MGTRPLGLPGNRCTTIAIGSGNPRGRSGSRLSSASSAPAEPPTTTASVLRRIIGSHSLVDARVGHELPVGGGVLGKTQAFLEPEAQKAAPAERIGEHADGPVLQR